MGNMPKGVLILAVLSIVSGGLMLLLVVATPFVASADFEQALAQFGMSQAYIMSFFGLIGALSLVSGIGMIRGSKWGWWLAVLAFAFAVLRAANSMLNISSVVEQFGMPPEGVSDQYIKFGGRIITNSLVIWYFFLDRVLSYFQMETSAKWKKLGILAGFTIAVGILFSVIAAIMGVGF